MHEQSVHGSRKYLCNSCNFQANTADDLRTHQKSVHIKGKFKCDQCDIDFSHKESISKHKESIQEKIMYPCSQCDYQSNWKENLKVHTVSIYEYGLDEQYGPDEQDIKHVPDERDQYTSTAMEIDIYGSQIGDDSLNTFTTLESGVADSYKMPTTTSRDDGYVPDATVMRDIYVHMIWPEYMAVLVQKEENHAMDGYEELDAMVVMKDMKNILFII